MWAKLLLSLLSPISSKPVSSKCDIHRSLFRAQRTRHKWAQLVSSQRGLWKVPSDQWRWRDCAQRRDGAVQVISVQAVSYLGSLKIASFFVYREFEVTDGVIHGCPGLEVFNETMTNPDHPGYYHGVRINVWNLNLGLTIYQVGSGQVFVTHKE